MKFNNADPNGGWKLLGSTVERNYTLEGWFYRPTLPRSGAEDRIAISDGNFNGYGVRVTGSNVFIERRTNGSPTNISSGTPWNRPDNQWYRFQFTANQDNTFTARIFDLNGTEVVSLTSNANTTHTGPFDRVVIHGGTEYYIDDLKVTIQDDQEGSKPEAPDDPTAGPGSEIAQQPLFSLLNLPGSLVLTPSVEWPTINSVANLGPYSENTEYAGYFDSNKCYQYIYDTNEALRHFSPRSFTPNRRCTSSTAPWSGNFLNWAATQTADPFRSALTGGYRVRDTPSETWLEKARHDGQGGTGIYPNRRLPNSGNNSSVMEGATPFSGQNWMRMRIQGLGNQMRFRLQNNDVNHNVIPYNPTANIDTTRAYEVSIRVAVCVTGLLESNCQQYQSGWKPEGTLQQYADRIRYSLFSYLNDSSLLRDGGVMRSKQKYIGPFMPDPDGTGVVANPRKEWDPATGVLIRNPDADWASDTNASIQDSGIINYLNKFGQMTNRPHKSFDPVSELYYAGLRYLRNLGNVSSYSSPLQSSANSDWSAYDVADGFPVITDWDDPVQHWCQPNTLLGIGDIYTHRDKNLPGSSCNIDEPSVKPNDGDNPVNVVSLTNLVGNMEGLNNLGRCNFTGRQNSAFMAGLAWHANAYDLRPDLVGGRTSAQTYWVDVLEAQSLEGMARNQFALTAKYGGANLPSDFDVETWGNESLPTAWWHSNNETLTPFGRGDGQASFLRPDNFFVAGDASTMITSLQDAFDQISLALEGTSTAASASSSVIESDTLVFTAGFRSDDWSGTLIGRPINKDGTVSPPGCNECWDAEAELANQVITNTRNIYTRAVGSTDSSGTGGGVEFNWNNLHSEQRAALDHSFENERDNRGEDRAEWIRGIEQDGLRSRLAADGPRFLGAIINSDPVFFNNVIYVGANDGMLHAFDGDTGEELFAYIPSQLLLPSATDDFAPLSQLTALNYSQNHRYTVDGKIAIREIFDGTQTRSILIGSLGAGGNQLFALDVTDPTDFSASNILWEFTHPDLGITPGAPQIARSQSGSWTAFFGNGYVTPYMSNQTLPSLFAVNLINGNLYAQIETTNSATNNGLAMPFVTDWPNGQFRASRAYAGDLNGNLWAFDLSSQTPSNWTVRLLAKATDPDGNPQPITTRPVGQLKNADEAMISFGTGSYLFREDTNDNQIQSIYGVIDTRITGTSIDRDDLLQQEIIFQDTFQTANGERELRFLSNNLITTERGWVLDLNHDLGERIIANPLTLGRKEKRVRFTSLIPDEDPCGSGRRGFLMDFNLLTGGRLDSPVFDLDDDGKFNQQDLVNIPDLGELPASGISLGQGESSLVIDVIDTESPNDETYQLICDGQGNCERARDSDQVLGRTSWQQIR